MLPTTGYFKNIPCPFYDSCLCERPYCHYRHSKQDVSQDANVISDLVSKAVQKVLSSTSNQTKVSDNDGETQRITYNPTPIATLNKHKSSPSPEKRAKRPHIPYSPQQPAKLTKIEELQLEYDVGDYVNTSVGYSPTPKTDSIQYIPSAIESLYQNQGSSAKTDLNQSYEPVIINSSDYLNLDVKYNPTNNDELTSNENTLNDYVPNYNDDFLEKFLNDPNIYEPTEISASKTDKSENTSKTEQNSTNSEEKTSKKEVKPSKSETKVTKSDGKHSKSKSSKSDTKSSKTSSSSKSVKTSKTEEKPSKNSTKTDKTRSDAAKPDTKSDKPRDKPRDNKGHRSRSSSSSKDKSRNKSDSKGESKSDRKSDRKSDSKSEKRSSSKSDKRSTEHRKKVETKRSSSKSAENGKSSHEQNGKSSSSHKSSKDRDKSKHKSGGSKDKPKPVPVPPAEQDFDIFSDDIFDDDDDLSDGVIDKNTLEQCKKIFDEYEAVPVVETAVKPRQVPVNNEEPQATTARKRTAHEGSSNIHRPKLSKPHQVKNPGLVMAARYKNIMAKAKEKDKPNFNTTGVHSKKEPEIEVNKPTSVIPRKPVQTPTEYNQLPGRNSRIAHVPNVSSLMSAKKKITEIKKVPEATKTPITTVAKGTKRIAHTSENCLTDTPTVLQSEKSKLPVNVRNRFLLLMITESMKIYSDQTAANERALNEELACYLRCTALNTYRNSCMLSINRLRKESDGIAPGDGHRPNYESEFVGEKFYENLHRWILTEQELIDNGYPRYPAPKKGYAVIKLTKPVDRLHEGYERCVRCKKAYLMGPNGHQLYEEDCTFHPHKSYIFRGEPKYFCCGDSGPMGCCVCSTHVFEIRNPNLLSGFVRTFDPDDPNDPRSTQVFALDCEMVYTNRGVELARVTIVNPSHGIVYDSIVRPLGDILDPNTRFSGLTLEMLKPVKTTIIDVQAALLLLFNSKTILIGHSLESDLKALRLIHSTVIDTAVLFPHKMGPPKKRGLRNLASDILKKIIQNNEEGGHDSAEDAITCMELVAWKLKEELKTR